MSVAEDHPGVSTLAGTPKQVRNCLRQSSAVQVLVLSFEHVAGHLCSVLAENGWASIISLPMNWIGMPIFDR